MAGFERACGWCVCSGGQLVVTSTNMWHCMSPFLSDLVKGSVTPEQIAQEVTVVDYDTHVEAAAAPAPIED